MRHVAGPRVELGTRTIFNLLGPLANPAGVKRQLVGVFAARLARAAGRGAGPARRRARLGGARRRRPGRADHDRPDPWSPSCDGGRVRDASRSRPRMPACRAPGSRICKGGDAEPNADALRALLDGVRGPYRDIVLLNAAARSGGRRARPRTCATASRSAAEAIDSGAAPGGARPAGRDHQRGAARHEPTCWPRSARVRAPSRSRAAKALAAAGRHSSAASPSSAAARLRRARSRAACGGRTSIGLIAEIKRASPSSGLIRAGFRSAGAGAGLCRGRRRLPVGADRRAVFPGRATRDLEAARAAVRLPVLRKDFMLDP